MSSVGVMASAVNLPDVLLEPFSNFTFAPWSLVATNPTIVAGGRTGTAAQTAGSSGRATYTIPTPSESDVVTIGFAWKVTTAPAGPCRIVSLWSDTNTVEHNRLSYDGPTGVLSLTRGPGSFLGNSAAGLITINTYAYIELQVTLHDTTGAAVVRVNGTPAITVTNADTKNAGTKTVYDTVQIGVQVAGLTALYDDLYITTGAGAPFKGSITIP